MALECEQCGHPVGARFIRQHGYICEKCGLHHHENRMNIEAKYLVQVEKEIQFTVNCILDEVYAYNYSRKESRRIMLNEIRHIFRTFSKDRELAIQIDNVCISLIKFRDEECWANREEYLAFIHYFKSILNRDDLLYFIDLCFDYNCDNIAYYDFEYEGYRLPEPLLYIWCWYHHEMGNKAFLSTQRKRYDEINNTTKLAGKTLIVSTVTSILMGLYVGMSFIGLMPSEKWFNKALLILMPILFIVMLALKIKGYNLNDASGIEDFELVDVLGAKKAKNNKKVKGKKR